MSTKITKFLTFYSAYLFLFLVFLTISIFAGLWLNIAIDRWTLPICFIVYSLAGLLYLKYKNRSIQPFILAIILTPLLAWGGLVIFGHTYDTSYDGPFYHEPAVIAMSEGWNPIHNPQLPLKTPNPESAQLIEGSPKVIWAAEASILKLTNGLNSPTFINLLFLLVACIFAYEGLETIGIKRRKAGLMALTTCLVPLTIDQLFSYREDLLSYCFLIIGLVSLVKIYKDTGRLLYVYCFLGSLLLIAGAKFSNLYILLSVVALGCYVCWHKKLYLSRQVILATLLSVSAAFTMLFNPLITNITKFHAPDYPYNIASVRSTVRLNGVPANIRNDSHIELFLYGLFSTSDVQTLNQPSYYAKIKPPFTFTNRELIVDSSVLSKVVGGYGVLFSGVVIVSIFIYIWTLWMSRGKENKKIILWATILIILILVDCLLIPVPNYARYNSQLYLMPIAVITAASLVRGRGARLRNMASYALLGLMALNFLVVFFVSSALQDGSFTAINGQLTELKGTHKTYRVYSRNFYTSYAALRLSNIKINPVISPLDCSNQTDLYWPPETTLCPVK